MFPQNLYLWLDWIINHGRALNCLCGKCAAITDTIRMFSWKMVGSRKLPFFYYSGHVFLPFHFAPKTISLKSLLALQVLPIETPACLHPSATISLLTHLLSIFHRPSPSLLTHLRLLCACWNPIPSCRLFLTRYPVLSIWLGFVPSSAYGCDFPLFCPLGCWVTLHLVTSQ